MGKSSETPERVDRFVHPEISSQRAFISPMRSVFHLAQHPAKSRKEDDVNDKKKLLLPCSSAKTLPAMRLGDRHSYPNAPGLGLTDFVVVMSPIMAKASIMEASGCVLFLLTLNDLVLFALPTR